MTYLNRDNFGVIVVCYDTPLDFLERLAKYIKVSNNIILVINRFTIKEEQNILIDAINQTYSTEMSRGSIKILELPDNFGIAYAMNIGVEYLSKNCDWIAFFDDDTTLICNSIEEISEQVQAAINYVGLDNFGILGLGYTTEKNYKSYSNSKEIEEKYTVITSGSIMRYRTLQEFGRFCDEYFIDSVDIEYCIRLKSNNKKVLKANKIMMIHPIGKRNRLSIAGIRIELSEHNSIRCYYIARNRILIGKKYLKEYPELLVSSQLQTIIHICQIILIEKDKIKKLTRTLYGIWHGIRNKSGKLVMAK